MLWSFFGGDIYLKVLAITVLGCSCIPGTYAYVWSRSRAHCTLQKEGLKISCKKKSAKILNCYSILLKWIGTIIHPTQENRHQKVLFQLRQSEYSLYMLKHRESFIRGRSFTFSARISGKISNLKNVPIRIRKIMSGFKLDLLAIPS